MAYAAFYSDVDLEVEEATESNRTMIQYKLYWTSEDERRVLDVLDKVPVPIWGHIGSP